MTLENPEAEEAIHNRNFERLKEAGALFEKGIPKAKYNFGIHPITNRRVIGVEFAEQQPITIYAVVTKGGLIHTVTTNFDQAVVQSCLHGNAVGKPFYLQLTQGGSLQVYNYKGGRMGEAVKDGSGLSKKLHTATMISPKRSQEDVRQAKVDHYKNRYAGLEDILQKIERQEKERESWEEASGYGSW